MELKLSRNEIVKRAQNFYWDHEIFEKQIDEDESYILNFDILKDNIFQFIKIALPEELSKQDLFEQICRKIYLTYKASDANLKLFGNDSPHGAEVYKACVFSTLCTFLNASKRIESMTINQFIIENDALEKGYLSQIGDIAKNTKQVSSLVDQRRKARNRALKKNAVYPKRPQWAAVSKDIVYESTLWCILSSDDDTMRYFLPEVGDTVALRRTYKRLGNLYNEIDKLYTLSEGDQSKQSLQSAYKKFLSRLHKIEYTDYLDLQKVILSYITRNKEYYGLNLYRFERKFKPYIIAEEMKCLSACQTAVEENLCLMQSAILNNISFPKLYKSFALLPLQAIYKCAEEFPRFLEDIVGSSCLILDELVENGTFGDDWENLFRTIMNELAEDVLYAPSQLNFSIKDGSQEKFEKLLAAPVFATLCGKVGPNLSQIVLKELSL